MCYYPVCSAQDSDCTATMREVLLLGELVLSTCNTDCDSVVSGFCVQVMFGQVETAFSSWLAESNRTVSTAQSDATSALTAAVAQLNSAVSSVRGDLADTSRCLSRMASTAAARTAEPGSGGGAISVALLEAGGGVRPAAPVDPRIEIGTLLGVGKYEDALVKALNSTSLDVLIWTCKQVGSGYM
eukprot:GHUV01040741.1.p2 GENE.GHUV01040741.1~~GHUV01040741.1.p2  ORF type:complete len:185 (-),score=62.03 GHUV01040741.1:562-1116(-)